MSDEEGLDLPPLQVTVLDAAGLSALFLDLRELADRVEIAVRGADGRAAASGWSLDDAHAALRDRRVAGVQVRYVHAGTEWWDTLQPLAEGVRLVRIDHTHAARAGLP